jgi:outer membrane autotransporter protein
MSGKTSKGIDRMKQQKSLLAKAVLASTIFCLYATSTTTYAVLTPLDAGANNQNSGNATYPPTTGYNYTAANVSFTIRDGDDIGETGTTSVDNNAGNAGGVCGGAACAGDTLIFAGSSDVAGEIGTTNPINNIFIQGGVGTNVFFDGDLFLSANGINFNTATPTASTQMEFGDNVIIFGNIDNKTGTANIGTLQFDGTNAVTGTIGATKALNAVNMIGPGDQIFFDGDVQAKNVNFASTANAGTTLILPDTVDITGNLDNTTGTANVGTVEFQGTSTVTGTVGATSALNQLNILDILGAGDVVTFDSNVTANLIQFAGGANNLTDVVFTKDGAIFTGNIDSAIGPNIGGVLFDGSGTITGNIGSSSSIGLISFNANNLVAKTATLTGTTINANAINLGDDGSGNPINGSTLILNNAAMMLNGPITPRTNDEDTLNILNANTLTGNIGAAGKAFHLIQVGQNGNTIINGNIFATNTTFFGNNALTLTNNKTITGNVDSNADNSGILQFQGNATVTKALAGAGVGNIGATHPLSLVSFNTASIPGSVITLQGPTYRALNSNIVATGIGGTVIDFNTPGVTNITSTFTTNDNNVDTLSFENAGDTTVNGTIGSLSHMFNQVLMQTVNKLTFNNNVFATNTQFRADGTIQFADNASTGAITTTVNNTGTVNYLGNSSVLFPIGTPGLAVKAVNFNGGPGQIVDLGADIVATNVNINNGGTLQVITSPTITGNVTVNNGVLSVANNNTLNITGPIAFSGPNSTLAVDMGGNLKTTSKVVATGAANMAVNTNLTILNPGFSPGKATVIPIFQGVGGVIGAPQITNSNTLLTKFSTLIVGDTLNLVLTSQPSANFATQSNSQGVAGALDIIAADGNATDSLANIIGQLSTFTDATSLNNALATLSPIVDGAIMTESFNIQNMIFGAIGDRMDRMNFWLIHDDRSKGKNKHKKGISSGDIFDTDNGFWVKMLFQHGNQEERSQIIGYNNHTWGVTVGADTMITEQSMVGASVSWTDLDVNDHVSLSKTNANSYQGTLYTAIDFNCPLFFNGYVGVAYNNYITSRNIVFNDLEFFPRGHFHGLQTGAKAEMGYIFGSGFHTIPLASLYYSHLSLRSYQETGASTANQLINGADFDTLLGGVGVKFVDDYVMNDYMLLQSEIHAMAFYDVIGDQMQLTSQFTGSGPSFITQGFTPAQASFDIGTSFILFTHYDFTLSANYDFAFKEDYTSNSGFLRVRYEW